MAYRYYIGGIFLFIDLHDLLNTVCFSDVCLHQLVDDGIALGYLLVNTGKHLEALDLFEMLLQKNPKLVAARYVTFRPR